MNRRGKISFRKPFVGAMAKMRKATISSVMSDCLSVRQLGSHWTDFHKIWYLNIFKKCDEKTQISIKSDMNNSTLHEELTTFMIISRWILFRMRNVSDKVCSKNQITHFRSITFFFRKSCLLWDNVEKYCRAKHVTNIIRRDSLVCWIRRHKHTTASLFNNYCFSTAIMAERTRLNITFMRGLPVTLVKYLTRSDITFLTLEFLQLIWEVLCSHCGVDEDSSLLEYDVVKTCNSSPKDVL
jgi:hypothetical protein